MRIWLVDLDGKMENLALMRLSAWHKAHGDDAHLKFGMVYPTLLDPPDKVYASCVFKWNQHLAQEMIATWGSMITVGGSGYDETVKLPDYVESMPPDYDLYGNSHAIGFISRGCPNKCPWCIVPRKEGKLRRVSTAAEIAAGHDEVIFLDNNFLALPDHCDDLRWLAQQDSIKMDFNQGLDARLITDENAALLAKCRYCLPGGEKVRLALDSISQKHALTRAIDILGKAGIKPYTIFVYCLIGYSGLESDIDRLLYLHSLRVRVFPMGYRDLWTGEEPATGWDITLYKKYKRLICRMPFSKSVWRDFELDTGQLRGLGNGA
jgi:hypothetical protein